MKTFTICTLLAAGVSAVPMVAPHHVHGHAKRAVVWVTETDVDVVTVPVTKTVWIDGAANTNVAKAHSFGGYGGHKSSTLATTTSSVQSESTSISSSSEYSAPAAPSTTSTTSSYVTPTSVYVPPTTTSTSEYVAPTTTSSTYVAPTTTSTSVSTPPAYTPTSTYEASSTTSTSAAPTSTGGSGASGSYEGQLSYYSPSVGTGSCGWTNGDNENVVAVDADMMNKATMCGAEISITVGDKTLSAKVVDTCPGCKGSAGLDLSPGLFAQFTSTEVGIIPSATWSFN